LSPGDEEQLVSIWDETAWSDKVYEERLSQEEIDTLAKALEEWATEHPLADKPLLYVEQATVLPPQAEASAPARGLTPRDIAQAVSDEGSPLREPVIRLFAVGLSGYSDGHHEAVSQVVEALHEDVQEWRAQSG
jgi:hypothetical protein